MKLLVDQGADRIAALSARYSFIGGQLNTPISRRAIYDGQFAIDNGAFAQIDPGAFTRLLDRLRPAIGRCLFVTVPDVPMDARRTLEVFRRWEPELRAWPLALAMQDGIGAHDIPWENIDAVFIGGSDAFKDGPEAEGVIRAALWLYKHVHIGRVNTPERWLRFEKLGAHTCDGSGVSRYDWMLDNIAAAVGAKPLWDHDANLSSDGYDSDAEVDAVRDARARDIREYGDGPC